MTTDLDRLIEAVEAGDDAAFLRYNRAVFATPAQDVGLQLREDDSYRAYRGSLDAAVMLLEALLPSAVWGRSLDGVMWVSLSAKTVSIYGFYRGNSDSPARSLLLATLRAYRSTREGG